MFCQKGERGYSVSGIMVYYYPGVATIVYILGVCYESDYRSTRRQINLYRMFFSDCSVNSQPIFLKFLQGLCLSHPLKKYSIAQKLDHLACDAILKL